MEENCRGNLNNFSCPQIMSDGRVFTDYRPRCISNIMDNSKNMNSYEYRQYLQANGKDIINNIRKQVYNANKCGPCVKPYNIGTMLPEKDIVTCNKSTCSTNVTNANGLGTGRKYYTESANEQNFISQKEVEQKSLQEFHNSCVLTHDDPLFYSYNKSVEKCERAFKPSGMLPLCKDDE